MLVILIFSFSSADLHQIIRSGQQLSNSHVQYFMYQLLRGMKARLLLSFGVFEALHCFVLTLCTTRLSPTVHPLGQRPPQGHQARKRSRQRGLRGTLPLMCPDERVSSHTSLHPGSLVSYCSPNSSRSATLVSPEVLRTKRMAKIRDL